MKPAYAKQNLSINLYVHRVLQITNKIKIQLFIVPN